MVFQPARGPELHEIGRCRLDDTPVQGQRRLQIHCDMDAKPFPCRSGLVPLGSRSLRMCIRT